MRQVLPKVNSYEMVNGKYTQLQEEVNSLQGIDALKLNYLRQNPFNYNSSKSIVQIYDIEEFIITIRKDEMTFGDIIRDQRFTNSRRKKYVKKSFKDWNKDYLKQKNLAFKESSKNISVIEEFEYSKTGFRNQIIATLLLLFLFFVEGSSRLWDGILNNPTGYYFKLIIDSVYTDFSWLRIVVNITIYITLLLIFYITFFNFFSKKFSKDYETAESFLNDSEASISRDYKVKYKKAKKYYLRNINNSKKPYYQPLAVKEFEEGFISIEVFNEVSKRTVDKAYNFKKIKPLLSAINKGLIILSLVGSACILVLILFKMVLSIFT